MDLVLAHLPSMCDSLGSFLGVAKTKNKTKQKSDTLLSWWIACLEWVTPGSTPNTAKCENNTQSQKQKQKTPCSERLRSRWAAAARSQAGACAPGGTLGLQMDPAKACRWVSVKAIHLPSNSSLFPASRGRGVRARESST